MTGKPAEPASPKAAPESTALTLSAWLDELAARYAQHRAICTRAATCSYAELAAASRRVACGLAQMGVNKGTHVGILLPNGADWLIAAWASWRLGAVVVALNTLWTARELERALRIADVQVLIAATHFLRHDYRAALAGLGVPLDQRELFVPSLPALRTILWWGDEVAEGAAGWNELACDEQRRSSWLEAIQQQCVPCERAAIFFTSGSEAEPKAVVHTHSSILAAARGIGERLGIEEGDRSWAYLPLFFAGGLVAFALATLGRGGTLLLQPVFDADEAISLMQEFGCTTFFAWPHQAEAIARHPRFARNQIGIRKGPGAQASWAGRIFADGHCAVSSWGMTEAGPMASVSAWSDPAERRGGTHGRPLPGVEIRIVDPDSGHPLPPGAQGEVCIRGATVMETYYGRRWQDCFDEQGFFHTGDLGWLDAEGFFHFAGRRREVIKTAGVNVAASEVEAILMEHPQVSLAVVVPVGDAERGETIAAFVVARGERPAAEELTRFCRARLASYKVPRHFFFVRLEELPSAGSGKYDKQALRRRAEQLVGR